MIRNKILATLIALEQAFPPGESEEGNPRHHALMANTYGGMQDADGLGGGRRNELGLHLWVGNVSHTLFIDPHDLEGPIESFIAEIKTVLHLNGSVQP